MSAAHVSPRSESIAHRLFKVIFLTYFIVTCIVTVMQLYFEYQKVKEDLQVNLKNLATTFQPVITEALWAFNDTELDAILFGIVKLDSITGVKISNEEGKAIKSMGLVSITGNSNETEYSQSISLDHNDVDDKKRHIGSVTLFSGPNIVFNKIKYGFFLIIVNSILKTIALWFIFLFFVNKIIGKPLSVLTQSIEKLHAGQSKNISAIENLQLMQHNDEIGLLTKTFNSMIQNLNEARKNEEERLVLLTTSHTARQVAHDIRSPLAALQVMSQYLGELPEEKRVLIRSAVQRMSDIANDLGGKKIADDKEKTSDDLASVQLLSYLIESLISEKRLQFRSRLGIKIESDLGKDSYGLFAKIQPVEFKRVLSNLVNNAVEAMDGKGQVVIEMKNGDFIQIIVSDNGKGIPSDILPKLMQKGATFGKENDKQSGSGLGLYHARESLKLWGGDIQLKSELGVGTKVILTLPKHAAPDWFVSEIKITDQTQIVILDDDSSIHHVWDGKLSNVKKENIFHFTTGEDVLKWCEKFDREFAIFLFDYELLGSKKTGLDVIEELGIAEKSILVTSRFEEENVRERCAKLKVKLLPKNLAGFVPIIFEKRNGNRSDAEYILIDDEEINRSTWDAVAKMQGKRLVTFSAPEVFLERMKDFDKNVNIYIDSHLGENIKGEAIAKIIHRKGFEKIYLCTGYSPKDFPAMPWITEIVGKTPPFGEDNC